MSASLLRRATGSLAPLLRSAPASHTTATCRHRAPRIPAFSHVRSGSRALHGLTQLRYPTDEPLGEFWSREQVRIVAVDYQEGLLLRLNDEIRGTEYEAKGIADTVIESATKREDALIFNYASQALNNSFFLDSLVPTSVHLMHDISADLHKHLEEHYGNVQQFISYMSAAAMGMVGSGWVWLVIDAQGRLATVATYGAGTMLIRARAQANPMGSRDLPLFGGAWEGERAGAPRPLLPRRKALRSPDGSGVVQLPLTADAANFKFFGQSLNPIMCISVHEHAWLHDYGVWGKEEYLKRFWTVLDWDKVSRYHRKWLDVIQAAPADTSKTGRS
ncbi:manganese and iron superoxide dismutase [Calocera cornea HHB12733]|uniref:Manganese and iron superoxide dismutase n=1 Tax=Calocera cornea HHB12733 TaxID=1353952 RepID=A0A165JWM4_9BASI|nr:manganese and iron superoxide dismutase [Calocera cornea HHB12733]